MPTARYTQPIIALALLVLLLVIATVIYFAKPAPKLKPTPPIPVLKVTTQEIKAQPYEFKLASFGTVQPRTQSLIVSQVSGVIKQVNPAFRDGGFFSKGDVLLQIDDRDYAAATKVAKATWIESQLTLEEEKARSVQALTDWERLGNNDEAPSDLVLRKPQLAAAEAQMLSARANYEKALLDLERTKITAPYDGRVKTIHVDLGQYVNSGTQLADVFATDVIEIRLPLKSTELALINLPENFRGQTDEATVQPSVTITSQLDDDSAWQGHIVRTEAVIDDSTQQLHVIAQVSNPFMANHNDKIPLKIGQYVTAQIEGKHLTDALVIPTSSLYQGTFVYVVVDGKLQRKTVSLLFQTPTESVVRTGLQSGDQVVTSPLGQVTTGTRVAAINPSMNSKDVSGAKNEGVVAP